MMTLQITWFILILVLLTGYAVLDGFDLGAGFWNLFLKDKDEKKKLIDSIGPFWDGNEVWLLTGGGAIFAAFPPVYATTFSAFYLAIMLIIFSLIFRACSIEFRGKMEGWTTFWDNALGISSLLPPILFGVAIGNILNGLPLNSNGDFQGTFFSLLNPYALLIGLTTLSMFAVHGAAFLANRSTGAIQKKYRNFVNKSFYINLLFLLAAFSWTLYRFYWKPGWSISVLFAFLSLAALFGVKYYNDSEKDFITFLHSGLNIVLNLIVVGTIMFPNFVLNTLDPKTSLTIFNSSSSQYTLTAMLILALIGMPIVIGYTIYIYKIFWREK